MNTQTQTQKPVDISDIKPGDVFSEESHYVYQGSKNTGVNAQGDIQVTYQFKHLESKKTINLDAQYVKNLLTTADQYSEEIEVGLEDKYWTAKQLDEAKAKGTLEANSALREGDVKLKGIRNLWADIHTTKVFSVCFDKKGKALTKKAYNAARDKQVQEALTLLSSGTVPMADVIKSVQDNPVVPIEKGEERILRGYKVQFASTNGYYDVIDMDKDDDGKGSNLRKVNINEIKWLVIDGIRYIVE